MQISCKSHADIMQISCKSHANLMQILCKSHAKHMQISCKFCANIMQISFTAGVHLMKISCKSCKSHANFMHIACKTNANLVKISYKSQAYLRYNSEISITSQAYVNKYQSNIRKILSKSQAYLRHNSDSPKAYLRHILVTDVMFLNYIYDATLSVMPIYDDDNDIRYISGIRHIYLIFVYCLSETILNMQSKIGQILLSQIFHTLVFTHLCTTLVLVFFGRLQSCELRSKISLFIFLKRVKQSNFKCLRQD